MTAPLRMLLFVLPTLVVACASAPREQDTEYALIEARIVSSRALGCVNPDDELCFVLRYAYALQVLEVLDGTLQDDTVIVLIDHHGQWLHNSRWFFLVHKTDWGLEVKWEGYAAEGFCMPPEIVEKYNLGSIAAKLRREHPCNESG
jgi:hypothetical protein